MNDAEQGVVGRPTAAAVDAVVAAGEDREPERVREALDPVTADGRVTRAALREAVSDTSKVVATAETRVELAAVALKDARDAADPVADLPVVATRLDDYADRLDAVEARVDDLGVDLPRPVGSLAAADEVYRVAVDLRETASGAQGVVRTADDLQFDLDQFESWLDDPERRYDEFAEDVDLVRESVAELEAAADALEAADDPAVDWADATMRTRVVDLLVADLRAELDDLRTWADREGLGFCASLADEVDALAERQATLADRLDDAARPAWRDRFGDDVDALAGALDELEPPVEWGAVEERLSGHRERAFGDN